MKMNVLAAAFAAMVAIPSAYAEETVMNVDFRPGTPVMAAIYALAQKSGHEVVFDDRIPGTFSMKLRDVTFGDAVGAIARSQNILCEERDGVMHVSLPGNGGRLSMLVRVSRQRARHNDLERRMQDERRAEEERQSEQDRERRRQEREARQEEAAKMREAETARRKDFDDAVRRETERRLAEMREQEKARIDEERKAKEIDSIRRAEEYARVQREIEENEKEIRDAETRLAEARAKGERLRSGKPRD